MSTILDSPAGTRVEPTVYAGFWIRFGAAFLDFVITLPLLIVSSYFLSWSPDFTLYLGVVVISMLYKPLTEGAFSATPGKRLLKLRVRKGDGSPIDYGDAFVRWVPWAVPYAVSVLFASQLFALPGYGETDSFVEMASMMQRHQEEIGTLQSLSNWSQLVPLVSALLIFFDARKQAAHDKLADTFVVQLESD